MSTYAFNPAFVNASPEASGVYFLFQGPELIYIGRAIGAGVTVRTRLQSHLRGDEGSCTQRATHYGFELTAYAAARETELLNNYRLRNGRLPRCNDRVG